MNSTPKTITLIAHRHQDHHGNTYHFVAVSIDGVRRHVSPVYYGYGRQYEDTAFDWLVDSMYDGNIVDWSPRNNQSLRRWCQDNGVTLDSRVSDHHDKTSPLHALRFDALAICRPFAGGWNTIWSDGIYTMQSRPHDTANSNVFRVVKDGKVSCHTDYPVMYDDGTVAYDRPESISQRMQTRVRSTMRRMATAV